ncbi:conserved hypothetical protein [Gammaproteobacteria bacterium]
MAKNFLIGVGGTGAKCVESFVHLCAAGLGPDIVQIQLIDQDDANGNLSRTKKLISLYHDLHSSFRVGNGGDRLAPETVFLNTEVITPKAGLISCPSVNNSSSLANCFNYNNLSPNLAELVDSLYSGESERDLSLVHGFHARPNVGAAIFGAYARSSTSAWNNLFEDVREAAGSGSVQVFLVGSIFGGTGASGFPTLARWLYQKIKKEKIAGVSIGGALMLPYVTYTRSSSQGTNPSFPTRFLDSTIVALRYYARLFQHEPPFQHLYLLGWDPLIELPNLGAGAGAQENPPLIPELYAALAGCKFFSTPPEPNESTQVFLAGYGTSEKEDQLIWKDVPIVRQGDQHDVKQKLSQSLHFGFAFHYVYAPFLSRSTENQAPWKSCQKEAWFKRLIVKQGVEIQEDRHQKSLANLQIFSRFHLEWFTTLVHASRQNTTQPYLFAADSIAKPNQPISILYPYKDIHRDSFEKLVYDSKSLSLSRIFWELTYSSYESEHHRLGILIGFLYDLCAQTN